MEVPNELSSNALPRAVSAAHGPARSSMAAVHASIAPPPPPPAALLAEITAGLAAGRDLCELLHRFLAPVVQLAGAQGGAVRVLSAAGEQLHLVGAIGVPAAMCSEEASVPSRCGFCGDAVAGSRVVWATDLGACRSRSSTATASWASIRCISPRASRRGPTCWRC